MTIDHIRHYTLATTIALLLTLAGCGGGGDCQTCEEEPTTIGTAVCANADGSPCPTTIGTAVCAHADGTPCP